MRTISHHPTICYRHLRLTDLDILERLHADMFPIRYESKFFLHAVSGHGIVSWVAVDKNIPHGCGDELVGFITARIIPAKATEVGDFIRRDPLKPDQTLVYILTLGVVETHRNLGIASSLIQEIIKYASSIPTCHAVYLHVITYNNAAIYLYKKMSFKCVQRIHDFYIINGEHYDSYLFLYYVNGGRSPCSPMEFLLGMLRCSLNCIKSAAARLVKNAGSWKWAKCKDTHSVVPEEHYKITLTSEPADYECG